MKDLTSKEVYDLIRQGAADGGWQGFAEWIQRAFKEKNESFQKELDYKQCIIDRLMMEFCPAEMTDEQWKNWTKHQRADTE